MNAILKNLLPIAVLAASCAGPAGAASSAASSASDSVAASVGSLSGSLVHSSDSSKGRTVADGDYRIIEVARDADRPGAARLKLVATAVPAGEDAGTFELIVPEPVVAAAGLATGVTIAARQRPYGIEFAQGEPRRAFFLALHDTWYRELTSTPVAL